MGVRELSAVDDVDLAAHGSGNDSTTPMRADARRNREKILHAALELFADEGTDVAMDTVAHRAGVGVGTLYRHFATKHTLISELVRVSVAHRVTIARQADDIDDPAEALRFLIHQSAKACHDHAGLRHVFTEFNDAGTCSTDTSELRASFAAVIDRARQVNAVREDIDVDGFMSLMCGLSASISAGAPWQCSAEVLTNGVTPQR